jgi:hypothetical protein
MRSASSPSTFVKAVVLTATVTAGLVPAIASRARS